MENYTYGNMYPNYYGATYGSPVTYSYNGPTPLTKSSLTEEELKMIQQENPNKLNLEVSVADNARAMCNHRNIVTGKDVVVQLNDGSGQVYCPYCQERWSPDIFTKEQVEELVDNLISCMQNAKWSGALGVQFIRDLFPVMPLLKKFPEIYEYAMKQFDRFFNSSAVNNANEASVYGLYNSLVGYGQPSTPYMNYTVQQNVIPQGYTQPQPNGYYGQPMNAPMGGYYQQTGMPATNVNPMQVQPNPYAPIAPTPGVPMAGGIAPNGMPVQGGVAPQNMAPATYAPAAAQTNTGVQPVVTDNANGTTTSKNSIKLS